MVGVYSPTLSPWLAWTSHGLALIVCVKRTRVVERQGVQSAQSRVTVGGNSRAWAGAPPWPRLASHITIAGNLQNCTFGQFTDRNIQ